MPPNNHTTDLDDSTTEPDGGPPRRLLLLLLLGAIITLGLIALPDGLVSRIEAGVAIAVVLVDLYIAWRRYRRQSND